MIVVLIFLKELCGNKDLNNNQSRIRCENLKKLFYNSFT